MVKRLDIVNGCVWTDSHIGSVCSPWLPDLKLDTGNILKMNEGQHKLLECMNDAGKEAKRRKVELVIVLDDVIDGSNWKESGRYLMTPNLNVQANVAVELMKQTLLSRIPDAKVFSVTGSRYHGSRDGAVDMTETMMDNLRTFMMDHRSKDAKGNPVKHFGWGFKPLRVRKGETDVKMFFRHGSTQTWIYHAQYAQREAWFAAQSAYEGKVDPIDFILMGHTHKVVSVPGRPYITLCPCWKCIDMYLGKRSYFRLQPDIGMTFFKLYPPDPHEIRISQNIRTYTQLYAPPKILDAMETVVFESPAKT